MNTKLHLLPEKEELALLAAITERVEARFAELSVGVT